MRRLVRRVRWTRVGLVGLALLSAFVTLRLWQWWRYAERQAACAELLAAQAKADRDEVDRLTKEMKDIRTLVHGKPDEVITYDHFKSIGQAIYSGPFDPQRANECGRSVRRLARGGVAIYDVHDYDWDARASEPEIRALWERLAELRAR